MVKSIIKRIIVGVAIALILMALKGQLLMEVHAAPGTAVPDTLCAINATGGSCNMSPVNTYQIFERPMYGNLFGSIANRSRIIWHFGNLNNDIQNKTYDLSFIIYMNGSSYYDYANRGFIQNSSTDQLFACDIDNLKYNNTNNTGNVVPIQTEGTATVTCKNVYINGSYFYFYLLDFVTSNNSGYVAISAVTMSENVSAKQAKELEDINDKITDDSVDDSKAESDIDDMKDKVASNGTITQLLTLPITMYQSILTNLNASTCSSFTLGSLFNHNLTLPCINLYNILGDTIMDIIDILCCGAFILAFRKKMVDIFNHMTSLNDRGNELE